jgi:hypothetical protein
MKTLKYETWVIEYDDALTRDIYRNITGGTKTCTCLYCANFSLARESVYPDDFKKLLDQLGIDSEKEVEVFQYNRITPGWQLYGGWFHFVGSIKENYTLDNGLILNQVPDFLDFTWLFTDRITLLPKPFGQNPVVQLDWVGKVPWVIDAEEPT